MNKLDKQISMEGTPNWFPVIFKMLKKIKYGKLEIVLSDGRTFIVNGENSFVEGKIEILNDNFFSRLVREGEDAFSESYLDGWWKTDDLIKLLNLIFKNYEIFKYKLPGSSFIRYYERLSHWLKSNNKFQAKKNIAYHYDLGNNFYKKWLDKSMTYSSAFFKNEDESLEEAQNNKYEMICQSLNLKPGDSVLDIGCGWGGFIEYAVKNKDVNVTGLTISNEQFEYTKERVNKLNLNDKALVLKKDYRDEKLKYDAVVSIEMFEAVGEKYWPIYFNILKDCLKPEAKALLQIITISDDLFEEYRKKVDFIQKYIFPGGMLPSEKALDKEVKRIGYTFTNKEKLTYSYSRTLNIWHKRFNNVWSDIDTLGFDDRFRRMWNFYFASCSALFANQICNVTQFTIANKNNFLS